MGAGLTDSRGGCALFDQPRARAPRVWTYTAEAITFSALEAPSWLSRIHMLPAIYAHGSKISTYTRTYNTLLFCTHVAFLKPTSPQDPSRTAGTPPAQLFATRGHPVFTPPGSERMLPSQVLTLLYTPNPTATPCRTPDAPLAKRRAKRRPGGTRAHFKPCTSISHVLP